MTWKNTFPINNHSYFLSIIISFSTITSVCTETGSLDVQAFGQLNGYDLGYVTINPRLNHMLNLQPIRSTLTDNFTACAVECLKENSQKCLSFNIEQENVNKHNCELLNTAIGDFVPKLGTSHVTITEVCWKNPCPPNVGFSCLPRDGSHDNLDCKCNAGYTGEKCGVQKLPKQGTSSQSSTYYTSAADNAIDGVYGQDFYASPCQHTNLIANQWWQFTFDFDVIIQSVVIYLRGDCCLERMEYADVEVYSDASATNFQMCGKIDAIGGILIKRVKCTSMLRGRGVRITQRQFDTGVGICEIDFFGIKL